MELTPDFVTQNWPLAGVILGPVLQCYSTRTVRALQATQGRFVIKLFQAEAALGLVSPSDEEIRRCLSVFDYLTERNYPHIPRLIATRRGERFLSAEGHVAYILEHVEGVQPPCSAQTYARLGALAAELNAFTDYPYPYPIDVAGTLAELRQHAEEYPFRDAVLEQVVGLEVLRSQPTSLIHAEINPANVLQQPDGSITLIDWDSTGAGPTVLEPGYPLITQFITGEGEFHPDWAAAYYDAYTRGAGMAESQRELVFRAAILHALRYMKFTDTARRWQRICYALEHKQKLLAAIPSRRT